MLFKGKGRLFVTIIIMRSPLSCGLNLKTAIILTNGTEKIRLFCSHPDVPLDESNLAYRAAKLMAENFPKVYANLGD